MFEKESEEWADKGIAEKYTSLEWYARKNNFQKGAEFGYNKCKEEINQKGLALQSDMDETIRQNIALKKENAELKAEIEDWKDSCSMFPKKEE